MTWTPSVQNSKPDNHNSRQVKREMYDYTNNLQGFPSHRLDQLGTRNLFQLVRIQLFTIGGRIDLNLSQGIETEIASVESISSVKPTWTD